MTDKQIRDLAYRLRWPETGGRPVCPRCGGTKIYWLEKKQQFLCANRSHSRRQFSVTTNTVWHDHRMHLRTIFLGLWFIATAAKSVSSMGLADNLKKDQKLAFILANKAREAILYHLQGVKLSGDIEIDATYFPRSRRRSNLRRMRHVKDWNKPKDPCILTLSQRGGPTIAVQVQGETSAAVLAAVTTYVEGKATLYTDSLSCYDFLCAYFEHRSVDHSVQFAEKDKHVNNAESFHARLKRVKKGIFHQFSRDENIILYVAEQAWKHSRRGIDTNSMWEELIAITLRHPPSSLFRGYYGHKEKTAEQPIDKTDEQGLPVLISTVTEGVPTQTQRAYLPLSGEAETALLTSLSVSLP